MSRGVYISNGPLGSSIGPSQGLCFADRLNNKMERVTITTISDGACMEGEAKESLAAIPGLAQAGKMAPYVLIISDNNTKLSGRIDEESFSMGPTFQSLSDLGWEVITLEKGNNLQACMESLELAIEWARSNPNKPVAVHAKTVKGYAIESTVNSSSGGHGFPLKNPRNCETFSRNSTAVILYRGVYGLDVRDGAYRRRGCKV
ncbi:MAG: thiamine pyrophosphate-dependent enzyme [Bdellovibrionales bacterium]